MIIVIVYFMYKPRMQKQVCQNFGIYFGEVVHFDVSDQR